MTKETITEFPVFRQLVRFRTTLSFTSKVTSCFPTAYVWHLRWKIRRQIPYMDTDIAYEVAKRKTRKRVIIITAITVILIGSVIILRASFSSSVKRENITTAVVETGNIENTITASGEILPEFEQII